MEEARIDSTKKGVSAVRKNIESPEVVSRDEAAAAPKQLLVRETGFTGGRNSTELPGGNGAGNPLAITEEPEAPGTTSPCGHSAREHLQMLLNRDRTQ
jgi:hypothetical protein